MSAPTAPASAGPLAPAVARVTGVDPYSVPLRVLHVAQPAEAGVARYVRAAAAAQAAGGWDVHVATAGPVDPDAGLTVHPWVAQRSPVRGVRAESAALRTVLRAVDPQVVVLHSSKAGMVGRLVLRGRVPTVYLPHAWSFLALPDPVSSAALAWERAAARWTSALVAVGDAEADEGVRRGIRAPFFVVRNPVPPGWSPVDPDRRPELRAGLGAAGGPLAVVVGRLSRQKGHDVLLDAWPLVLRRAPGAALAVVGDGDLRAGLQARGVPQVRFVGPVADPRAWVGAADVVVLPSRWEGCSLSMLEAMASARSVVTTAVAGSEVVAAGAAGAVVPVEDPAALAAALADRLTGAVDADAEGRRGAAHAAAEHDARTAFTRLAAVVARAHAFGR